MQEIDVQDIITQIILQAQSGEHTEFQKIQTWAEYFYYLGQKRSLKAVIKILKVCAKCTLNSYCDDILEGCTDLNKLIAHGQFQEILDYYKQERKTVIDMLNDFENYQICGGFIKSLLGIPRGD